MEDMEIIDLFWNRSEEAIVQTDIKYGRYCRTIAFNILCDDRDSEECVNDTYLKAWSIIPPRRPSLLSALLAKITRNLSLDRCRYYGAGKRGKGQVELALEELSACIPAGKTEDEIIESRLLAETLNRFLESLRPEHRNIFMLRYWYLCSIRQIAESLCMTEGSVKMILSRTRKHLREQLKKEGIFL